MEASLKLLSLIRSTVIMFLHPSRQSKISGIINSSKVLYFEDLLETQQGLPCKSPQLCVSIVNVNDDQQVCLCACRVLGAGCVSCPCGQDGTGMEYDGAERHCHPGHASCQGTSTRPAAHSIIGDVDRGGRYPIGGYSIFRRLKTSSSRPWLHSGQGDCSGQGSEPESDLWRRTTILPNNFLVLLKIQQMLQPLWKMLAV